MPVARVNDIELNYKLEGDGEETIVLVNGLADDLETWVLQMGDLLSASYRVLRFDNRGIGASSKPPGPYSIRMLAADAKGLVDSLGITGFPGAESDRPAECWPERACRQAAARPLNTSRTAARGPRLCAACRRPP